MLFLFISANVILKVKVWTNWQANKLVEGTFLLCILLKIHGLLSFLATVHLV